MGSGGVGRITRSIGHEAPLQICSVGDVRCFEKKEARKNVGGALQDTDRASLDHDARGMLACAAEMRMIGRLLTRC